MNHGAFDGRAKNRVPPPVVTKIIVIGERNVRLAEGKVDAPHDILKSRTRARAIRKPVLARRIFARQFSVMYGLRGCLCTPICHYVGAEQVSTRSVTAARPELA